MNNNLDKYNELIDQAYSNYLDQSKKDYSGKAKVPETWYLPKNLFIEKCKYYPKFSENWGIRFEQRELTQRERLDLFREKYPDRSIDDFAPGGMEVQSIRIQIGSRLDNAEIPDTAWNVYFEPTKGSAKFEHTFPIEKLGEDKSDSTHSQYCPVCEACGEDGCCSALNCQQHPDGSYCSSYLKDLQFGYRMSQYFENHIADRVPKDLIDEYNLKWDETWDQVYNNNAEDHEN